MIAATCKHCDRDVNFEEGLWVDPEAAGDDSIWRETCDSNEDWPCGHEVIEVDEEVNKTLDDIVLELTQLRDNMHGDQYIMERLTLNTVMDRITMHKRGTGRD